MNKNIEQLLKDAEDDGLTLNQQVELIELLMQKADVVETYIEPSIMLVDNETDEWQETGKQTITITIYNEQ